jgi:hypothetical protein
MNMSLPLITYSIMCNLLLPPHNAHERESNHGQSWPVIIKTYNNCVHAALHVASKGGEHDCRVAVWQALGSQKRKVMHNSDVIN